MTDEQIALFRHSEIQALLRERRHREEALEQDVDGSAEAADRTATQQTLKRKLSEQATSEFRQPSNSKKKRKKRPSKRAADGPPEYEDSNERSLRTINRETGTGEEEEDFTPRREAREQDEVTSQYVELDYG